MIKISIESSQPCRGFNCAGSSSMLRLIVANKNNASVRAVSLAICASHRAEYRQTGRRRVLIAHAHCARSLPESGTCATGCQSASVTRSAFDGHLMRSGSEKREEKVIRWIVSGLDTDLKRDQPPFSIDKVFNTLLLGLVNG